MNREIKFRGLATNSEEPKWLYGSLVTGLFHNINTKEDCALIIDPKGNPDFDCLGDLDDLDLDVDIKTVGQFTGLKDKNGKEIYEGDWLRICAGYSSRVEFQDGMFVSVYEHWEDPETIPLIDAIGNETEIVGNIHEQ